MEMEAVESSAVSALGYEADSEVMMVRFKTGAEYVYHNVSYDTFMSIKESPSIGREIRKYQGVAA